MFKGYKPWWMKGKAEVNDLIQAPFDPLKDEELITNTELYLSEAHERQDRRIERLEEQIKLLKLENERLRKELGK